MTNRNEITYNRIVGRAFDGSFIALHYTFASGNFHGATGSIFELVSKAAYEEALEEDAKEEFYEEVWRMDAGQDNGTTDSLADFVESIDDDEYMESLFDQSYSEVHDQIRALGFGKEDYPAISCVGGGRMFPGALYNIEVPYWPEGVEIIWNAEAGN